MRTDTGRTFWTGTYDRELGDVLALQREVARIVAREVGASVAPGESVRPAASRTVVPEAYESYLKGLFSLNKGPDHVGTSVMEFENATARDPTFAPSHAGLAEAYQALGSTAVGVLPVAEARPKAIAAARRALEIDPHLARTQAILAFAHQQEWRWDEAEAAYRRATEIDPNDSVAYGRLGALLMWRGRTEQGLAHARRAGELDPLSMQRTVNGMAALSRASVRRGHSRAAYGVGCRTDSPRGVMVSEFRAHGLVTGR